MEGERLEFAAGYSAVHLHEALYGVRGGRIEVMKPILGRDKLQ